MSHAHALTELAATLADEERRAGRPGGMRPVYDEQGLAAVAADGHVYTAAELAALPPLLAAVRSYLSGPGAVEYQRLAAAFANYTAEVGR